MCVIAYKSADVKVSGKTLWHMWEKNPDGAGLAYPIVVDDKPMFTYEKGFMNYKAFKRRVKELNHLELVFHMRIKTHGKVCEEMCHPFPVLPLDAPEVKQLTGCVEALLFHNGALTQFGSQEVSDTFDFTTNVLAHLNTDAQKKVLNSFNGKFILCTGSKIIMFGDFKKYEGLEVSNDYFKPWKPVVAYGGNSMGYGYDYGYNSHNYCRRGSVWDRDRGSWSGTQKSFNFDKNQSQAAQSSPIYQSAAYSTCDEEARAKVQALEDERQRKIKEWEDAEAKRIQAEKEEWEDYIRFCDS